MEGQGRRYSLSWLCYATYYLYRFTTQLFSYSCSFTWKLLGGVDGKYWLFYPAAIREMSSNTSYHKIGMSALMSLSPPQICWAGQISIFLASLKFWAGNNNWLKIWLKFYKNIWAATVTLALVCLYRSVHVYTARACGWTKKFCLMQGLLRSAEVILSASLWVILGLLLSPSVLEKQLTTKDESFCHNICLGWTRCWL